MPYIDSEALKKKIFPYGMPDNGNYGINAKSVMVAIEKAPIVNAVDVVRCEKCHFYEEVEYYPSGSKNVCRLFHRQMQADDYCSYGERKNDNAE